MSCFSQDNRRWFLTCMGSQAVIVGDAQADKPIQTVKLSKPYPHGIAIHDGIDRVLVTSTVRASDLGDAGEAITAIEASTGKVLDSYKVSKKASPAGEAPVEILFVPGAKTPVAYVTNMYGASLWSATWNAQKKASTSRWRMTSPRRKPASLEIYFSPKSDRYTSPPRSPDTCTSST
jgi:hypothetical protein